MIATRELATNSGKVMKEVDKCGFVVITKDGKPRSIIIPTSEDTLIPDVRSLMNLRLKRLLRKTQANAAKKGVSNMTMEEIDAEIAETRKARRRVK